MYLDLYPVLYLDADSRDSYVDPEGVPTLALCDLSAPDALQRRGFSFGTSTGTAMERCRLCGRAAIFIAVLHDGAKVPYCAGHLPRWQAMQEIAYLQFIQARGKGSREA